MSPALRDPRISKKSVNAQLADRAIRHAVYLERYKKHEVKRINSLLARKVVPGMLAQAKEAIRGERRTMQRRLFLLNETLRTGMRITGQESIGDLKNLALTEAEWQRAVLRQSVPLAIDFDVPQIEVLHDLVESTPFQNRTIQQWWDTLGDRTSTKIRQEVSVGLAGSETNEQIIERVAGVGKRLEDNADAIVRTTINDVSSKTREKVYKVNQDVIGSVQLVATLDLRTTFICMTYDGQVFPVDQGPRPPFHWNCRTVTIPVTKSWRELGVDRDEIPSGTRASMNGQVSMKSTYSDWLKDQGKDFQDEALGPVRAELFRGGHVEIDRFIDRSGHKYTLDELAAREGIEEEVRRARER